MISHADFKPYRALAAAVMLDAHNALHGSGLLSRNSHHTARHWAKVFFLKRLSDGPVPFNLNFCCEVLELNPHAVAERVRDMLKTKGAVSGSVAHVP
jgi:hypothetical protein